MTDSIIYLCPTCGESIQYFAGQVVQHTCRLGTRVNSYTLPKPTRTVRYAALATEELRDIAKASGPGKWDQWDRAQLLAFFHNRNRSGYFIVIEETPDEIPAAG